MLSLLSAGNFSCPKKTDLKVGESSAFLTYVKSNVPTSGNHFIHVNHNSALPGLSTIEETHPVRSHTDRYKNYWQQESYSHGSVFVNNGENVCNMSTFPMPMKFPVICLSSSNIQPQSRTEGQNDVSSMQTVFPVPIYLPGMTDQNMIPTPVQMFQGSLNEVQVHNTPAMLPQSSI